jgi:hypothetical protein
VERGIAAPGDPVEAGQPPEQRHAVHVGHLEIARDHSGLLPGIDCGAPRSAAAKDEQVVQGEAGAPVIFHRKVEIARGLASLEAAVIQRDMLFVHDQDAAQIGLVE